MRRGLHLDKYGILLVSNGQCADVAQWQSNAFVMRLLEVRFLSSALIIFVRVSQDRFYSSLRHSYFLVWNAYVATM